MPPPKPKPSLAEPPKALATEVGRVITVDISGAARAFLASLALWQHICDEEDPEAAVAVAQSLAEGDVRAHQPPF